MWYAVILATATGLGGYAIGHRIGYLSYLPRRLKRFPLDKDCCVTRSSR